MTTKKNCQTGYAEICAAAKHDGVVCPDDSCDINDGLRCADNRDVNCKQCGRDFQCCNCIRAAISSAVPDGGKGEAVYQAKAKTESRWQDCDSEGFEHMKGSSLFETRIVYTAPQAECAPRADLHPATVDLVRRFSEALANKLAGAEKKYGYSDAWQSPNWMDECRAQLMRHIEKGDPRDVAAYCAFLWHHGESTATHAAPRALTDEYKRGFEAGYVKGQNDSYETADPLVTDHSSNCDYANSTDEYAPCTCAIEQAVNKGAGE
jgi:hypothetical protein